MNLFLSPGPMTPVKTAGLSIVQWPRSLPVHSVQSPGTRVAIWSDLIPTINRHHHMCKIQAIIVYGSHEVSFRLMRVWFDTIIWFNLMTRICHITHWSLVMPCSIISYVWFLSVHRVNKGHSTPYTDIEFQPKNMISRDVILLLCHWLK